MQSKYSFYRKASVYEDRSTGVQASGVIDT